MKKLILLLVAFMITLSFSVFAQEPFTFTWERKERSERTGRPECIHGKTPVVVDINGVPYLWATLGYGMHPLKYNENNLALFRKVNSSDWNEDHYDFRAYNINKDTLDVIETEQYYMVRQASYDTEPSGYYKFIESPVWFYDKDLNLVEEHNFDGYPKEIGYYEGTFYCYVFTENDGGYIAQSTDMVNWSQIGEGYYNNDFVIPQTLGDVTYKFKRILGRDDENAITLTFGGDDYMRVKYEEELRGFGFRFGDYTISYFSSSDTSLYFSNNNIYSVKITTPEPIDQRGNLRILYAYENGDELVIETPDYIYRTQKQPIYDALERLKSAPYVSLNNTILGFEEPPVVEDGNMLVPMRFLFEQMGAEVAWDNDTQTATVTQNNDNISFQINNATATVNDVPKTMNVPAKLVNDKTMVPIRFLSENLGYTVDWDGDANMAIVNQ